MISFNDVLHLTTYTKHLQKEFGGKEITVNAGTVMVGDNFLLKFVPEGHYTVKGVEYYLPDFLIGASLVKVTCVDNDINMPPGLPRGSLFYFTNTNYLRDVDKDAFFHYTYDTTPRTIARGKLLFHPVITFFTLCSSRHAIAAYQHGLISPEKGLDGEAFLDKKFGHYNNGEIKIARPRKGKIYGYRALHILGYRNGK